MVDVVARFLFRHRNGLFPLVVVALLVAFPPTPLGDPVGGWLLAAGVVLIVLGQTLRIVTIGLEYVKRGGKGKQFFAYGLVTGGVFAHCRNPMYVGNLGIVIGVLLIAGDPSAIAIGTAFFVLAYAAIIHGEERYLAERFGSEFAEYCRTVPRWRVRLRGLATTIRSHRFRGVLVIGKEYGTIFSSVVVAVTLVLWKVHRAAGWDGVAAALAWAGPVLGLAVVFYVTARVLKKTGGLGEPRVADYATRLARHRAEIDRIDGAVLRLLNERAEVVDWIFRMKAESGVPRFDGDRTARIIERLVDLNTGPLETEQVERIFSFLLGQYVHLHDHVRPSAPAVVTVPHAVSVEGASS